jgi:hypothetical protein
VLLELTDDNVRYIWLVIAVLALGLIGVAIYEMSIMDGFMESALEMSGSSATIASLDEGVVGTLRLYLGGTILHGIWFGIFGLVLAWGIRTKMSFARKMWIVWGVLLLSHGVAGSMNQMIILNWPTVCPLSVATIIGGITTLGLVLLTRRG